MSHQESIPSERQPQSAGDLGARTSDPEGLPGLCRELSRTVQKERGMRPTGTVGERSIRDPSASSGQALGDPDHSWKVSR